MRDEALMAAYANGESLAFEALYHRHKYALFLFLRRQMDNAAVCEELAHDTWFAVINQASTYQATAKFKTWLFRIAHNRLVDHWRKQSATCTALFDEIVDAASVMEDTVSQGLELSELLRNLESLSTEQTETLLLKIEGFSHAEIAEITHCKQETVKSRLRYATKRLRLTMEA